MASYNKVILMGNLTREIEALDLKSGTRVAKSGLAENRVWYDRITNEKRGRSYVCRFGMYGQNS